MSEAIPAEGEPSSDQYTGSYIFRLKDTMNLSKVALLGLLAALILSGCSTPAQESPPNTSPSVSPSATSTQASSPSTEPSPTRKETARGELIKGLGEEASWGYEETGIALHFKVTSIEPVECDAYGSKPNGIALAVAMEITTDPEFRGPISVNDVADQISFEPRYWRGYEPDGTRMNNVDSSVAQGCLSDRSQLIPGYFGKGEKINGLVILDVTTPNGTIVADPAGGGGWAWEY